MDNIDPEDRDRNFADFPDGARHCLDIFIAFNSCVNTFALFR